MYNLRKYNPELSICARSLPLYVKFANRNLKSSDKESNWVFGSPQLGTKEGRRTNPPLWGAQVVPRQRMIQEVRHEQRSQEWMRTGEIPFDIGQNEVINRFKGETFSNLMEGVGGSDPWLKVKRHDCMKVGACWRCCYFLYNKEKSLFR